MTSTATKTELAACKGVTVIHGTGTAQVRALKHVDFSLNAGERVSLLGPSGSGKTTLLHVLGGLLVPEEGVVMWRGSPLSSLDAAARGAARSAGIAYIFQGANLLPNLTAYENVAFAASVRGHAGEDYPSPRELLELVGLGAKLEALSGELSGGEAQRVAIARALAQKPSLLLCDEPTGHLDTDTGSRVLTLIDALHEMFGFAQVTATHDATVAARAGRIVRLADGHVQPKDPA